MFSEKTKTRIIQKRNTKIQKPKPHRVKLWNYTKMDKRYELKRLTRIKTKINGVECQ